MRRLRALLLRLGGFFRRPRADDEFAAEIDSHLQMHIEDNLRDGMSRQEARRHALIRLGGVTQTQENYRERRSLPFLETLFADLRFGARMLRKNSGFTFIAALTLALGIAANATIFSFVSAILFRNPAVDHPSTLVVIFGTNPAQVFGANLYAISAPNYFAWKQANSVFSDMAAADSFGNASLTGESDPQRVPCSRTSANYFSVLGVPAALGRTFAEGEDQPGREHVVVLSYTLWKERFGSEANIAGKQIRLNGEFYTIVGVMPATLRLIAFQPKLWMPLVLDVNQQGAGARENRNLQIFGRLKPGRSLEQARAEFATLSAGEQKQYPDTEKGWGVDVLTLRDYMSRQFNAGPAFALLMGAVAFVLLIACANIAGLLVARATARGKEMAIRAALGAGRLRVARQVLTEALLIAILGGTAGLALTFWGADLLRAGLSFNEEISNIDIRIDGTVLFYTAAISLLAALLFGLAPAVRVGTIDVYSGLKNDSATVSGDPKRSRLRGILVVGEIAVAVVLLCGTGLFAKGIYDLSHRPLGFDPQHLLMARISLDGTRYTDRAKQMAFFRNLLRRLESTPELKEAAVASDLPATGATEMTFRLRGQESIPSGERPRARYFVVSTDYLRTAGIALLAGRQFTESDSRGSVPVALVSEVFVRRFFPKGDAIGQTILIDSGDAGQSQRRQIVGVVANVKNWPLQNADDPEMYEPFLQRPASDMAVILRTEGNPSLATPALRQAVWSLDKDLPLGSPVPMSQLLTSESAGERVMETILSIFSGLALLLSAVGLYGLLSYHVTQRRREIGIRLAMGAAKSSVMRLVLRDGMKRAFIGAGIGIVIALPLPKLFTVMFRDFYVRGDWLFVVVPLVMIATAILACYVPARRAARVDPMVALRYE
jgi:putative ABC transport system permease protein